MKTLFYYRRFSACVCLAAENQPESTLECPCAPSTWYPSWIIIHRRSSSMAWRILTHMSTADHANYSTAGQM